MTAHDTRTQALHSVESAAQQLGGISPFTLRRHIFLANVEVTRMGRRVFLSADEIARIQREGLPSLKVGTR